MSRAAAARLERAARLVAAALAWDPARLLRAQQLSLQAAAGAVASAQAALEHDARRADGAIAVAGGRLLDALLSVGRATAGGAREETSTLPVSSGDEAGSLGGVVSSVNRGPIKFTTASSKVYAKGKRVILANALTAHHGDNANQPAGHQISPSQGGVFAAR